MSSKSNFLKRRELTRWWVTVAHDDKFAEVFTHARAMFMENQPTKEMIHGAEDLIRILESMTDGPESDAPFPSPGIIHSVDTQEPKPKTEVPQKKGK